MLSSGVPRHFQTQHPRLPLWASIQHLSFFEDLRGRGVSVEQSGGVVLDLNEGTAAAPAEAIVKPEGSRGTWVGGRGCARVHARSGRARASQAAYTPKM